MLPPIADRIAQELDVRAAQINAAIALMDEGATVPFIARYRKEVTDGLDDTQLRHLDERLGYLRELGYLRMTCRVDGSHKQVSSVKRDLH